eukprot:CAMPEP_0197027484 /NCGR_PEP_ID=MMETSP1384-20130603/7376_1 /TAXON_ID=29189 /ORGANISM="Ammonia sp." /LENGTH=592 /DNA_ID=CAMNT_0042456335 /DNA_START=20 /DNA_END=1798 /DNA_ORIENTATION=+
MSAKRSRADAELDTAPSSKRHKSSHSASRPVDEEHIPQIGQNELELMELLDDAEELEALNLNTLRAMMKSLKDAIVENQKQRSKFSESPLKFKDSEIALNDVIQDMALKLPESPDLYREFVNMNGVDYLLTLLQHENIDIVSTVIGLIKELSEADNYLECESAIVLMLQFIQQHGIQLLVQNLSRLHDPNIEPPSQEKEEEEKEDDSETIFAVLSTLENLSEIDMDFCVEVVKQCKLFKILLNMMRKKQQFASTVDEIQLYLSELLCIYLQPLDHDDDEISVIYKQFAEVRGCEKLVDLLQSKYMKIEEERVLSSEEKEYVSNLMDALSSALASTLNQDKFYESNSALKKLLSLIKEKNFLKQGCLQALSFAVTDHQNMCVKLVEVGGLKTVFAEFMNRHEIKKKYKKEHDKDKMEEYLCCILVHLFCNLSNVNLWRLMKKFREKDYTKIDRLIELHTKYLTRLEENDLKESELRKTNEVEAETFGERYARRLENGLYTLQLIDILIAFVYTFPDEQQHGKQEEKEAMKERMIYGLNQCDMDIDQVKAVLTEYFNVTHPREEHNKNQKERASVQVEDDLSLGSIAGKLVNLM